LVLAVTEDWGAGGAGNGLGTLYAYRKACAAALPLGVDLPALLLAGSVSAALFHTAGKGTRLAPLPAAENNNKPAVRLPATVLSNSTVMGVTTTQRVPMTVLEAVVLQTGAYAASRRGRLSVFWGDQIFVPSVSPRYQPKHHVDIMCTLGEMVGEEEWASKGLEKYGVIAVSSTGAAAQVEKVSHATAVRMLANLGDVKRVGPSLGSFSLSSPFLAALMDEYAPELARKEGKMDTDPHFWMPLTLSEPDYVSLMTQKKVPADASQAQYKRMAAFKERFFEGGRNGALGLFGAVDVGAQACWWDYGQLKK
jgi:hypothetical protein